MMVQLFKNIVVIILCTVFIVPFDVYSSGLEGVEIKGKEVDCCSISCEMPVEDNHKQEFAKSCCDTNHDNTNHDEDGNCKSSCPCHKVQHVVLYLEPIVKSDYTITTSFLQFSLYNIYTNSYTGTIWQPPKNILG